MIDCFGNVFYSIGIGIFDSVLFDGVPEEVKIGEREIGIGEREIGIGDRGIAIEKF